MIHSPLSLIACSRYVLMSTFLWRLHQEWVEDAPSAVIRGGERGYHQRQRRVRGRISNPPAADTIWGLGFTDFSISLLAINHLSSDNKCHTVVSGQWQSLTIACEYSNPSNVDHWVLSQHKSPSLPLSIGAPFSTPAQRAKTTATAKSTRADTNKPAFVRLVYGKGLWP